MLRSRRGTRREQLAQLLRLTTMTALLLRTPQCPHLAIPTPPPLPPTTMVPPRRRRITIGAAPAQGPPSPCHSVVGPLLRSQAPLACGDGGGVTRTRIKRRRRAAPLPTATAALMHLVPLTTTRSAVPSPNLWWESPAATMIRPTPQPPPTTPLLRLSPHRLRC